MAKSKTRAKSISSAADTFTNDGYLPVYLFFGDDSFSLDKFLVSLEKSVQPLIKSEFDKEIFHGEEKNLIDILDFASAFPFGSGKKLIIVKEFEKIKDKKNLTSYLDAPPDFTILILIYNGSISNLESEPYKSLINNGYIFEAKELRGEKLVDWLLEFARSKDKIVNREEGRLLIDLVGEDRALLESQLEKIIVFLGDKKELTLDSIKSLSTQFKEYGIFDLQNALGKKDKINSFKIAERMIGSGVEPTFIVFMLTKYFMGLSRVQELTEKKVPVYESAKLVGTHHFYYKDYQNARRLYSDSELYNAVKALLKADLSIKTSTIDKKSIVSLLIAEILR